MQPPSSQLELVTLVDGIAVARPTGASSLVAAVDLVKAAIVHCRQRDIPRLLFNGTGLTGVPVPNLVDRFLMVEDWAHAAGRSVVVGLVVHPDLVHPDKFGVVLAGKLGFTCDVFTSEESALRWLTSRGWAVAAPD